ncbi:MAG: hypothetical protein V3T26_06015 [candidate division NC10 bacterium]
MRIKTRKGIYYFPSFGAARDYAESHGLQEELESYIDEWEHWTDRIIAYQVGWAIQRNRSGLYWGPQGWG